MRSVIPSLITLLLITSNVLAQSTCSKYYPFEEGATFQITNYDKKGKTTGIADHTVSNVSTVGGAEVSTISSKIKDNKGELLIETSYDITCKDDTISIDFNSLANPQMFEQYQEMDVDISGTNIDIPNNLSAGQELPDASMLMVVNMGISLKFTVDITNRKVIAEETITTPAGTFDCYVIGYTLNSKMGIKFSGSSKEWISEGVGVVKQESYSKKGKLTSSSELTAFNN